MNPVLVFDIETVPDVQGIRRIRGVGSEVSDGDVAAMALQLRRQMVGHDFLPLHLQRVVVISCALCDAETFKVWSLGGNSEEESEIIQRFFDGIEKYTPQLVSWNGTGFDMPVLHYRGLIHGVRAPRYWDTGDDDREFRFN
ncbi:MAG TPA: ribonuclease H-like domain-containing protein, partial [Gemmatimonadaceae bacterium]|nr:ribonuclease H-like domain-containing protein [Gemmatimonadaceae bacterium]